MIADLYAEHSEIFLSGDKIIISSLVDIKNKHGISCIAFLNVVYQTTSKIQSGLVVRSFVNQGLKNSTNDQYSQ